jgi:hypothetical protein
MRISRLFKGLRRWSSQAFRKRHSPAAFRTCTNAGNSVLTVRELLRRGQEALFVRLSFVFFTDSVSELYGQRMYIFICGLSCSTIFPTCSYKQQDFLKIVTECEMCVIVFTTNFDGIISHSKKNSTNINIHRYSCKLSVILATF